MTSMNSVEKIKGQTLNRLNDHADHQAGSEPKEGIDQNRTAHGNIYMKNEMARELREKGFHEDAVKRILHLNSWK